MTTSLKMDHSTLTQKVEAFTGEGAYHGSTRNSSVRPPRYEVLEMRPTTLSKYANGGPFEEFTARFPNLYEVKAQLPVPTQEQMRNDGVTFCWCPLEEAIQQAGPLTKSVLMEMSKHVEGKKKYVYVDSKIQYFQKGDLPVDSKLWHVDGTIAVRDQRVKELGYEMLHDMRARMVGDVEPPKYLAYQSSTHCATEFAVEPVTVQLPDFITSFDGLDRLVQEYQPLAVAQPAASIVSFDGYSLHRAVPAKADGWRLWVRLIETDREVKLNTDIITCYGTVFRDLKQS